MVESPRSGGIGAPAAAAPSGARATLAPVWAELTPIRRLAVVGLLASAVAVFAVAIQIGGQIEGGVIDARGRMLLAAVAAVEPRLPDLTGIVDLSPTDSERIESATASLLGGGHVRVSLWTPDGRSLHPPGTDDARLDPDMIPNLQAAIEGGVVSMKSTAPGGEQLVRHFVAVHDPDNRRAVAVLESLEDMTYVQASLQQSDATLRGAFAGGLLLLAACVALLLVAVGRSSGRQRALAEERAHEFALLSSTATAVASSLEPGRLFATLRESIVSGIGLERLSIRETGKPVPPGAFEVPLRDGTSLVAERSTPLDADEEGIIRAAGHSIDAGIANTVLLAETSQAAVERQRLLTMLAAAHEEERKLLVGELHDTLASDLIRMLYAVRRLQLDLSDATPEAAASMASIELMIEDAETDLRAYMSKLRPAALDVSDLVGAITAVTKRFRVESGMRVRLRVQGGVDGLHAAAQVVLVRALEEALLNIEKHAGASRIGVSLIERGEQVVLAVGDDGRGWPESTVTRGGHGLGLGYLRERIAALGGSIDLQSSRMGGARLEIRVPKKAKPA